MKIGVLRRGAASYSLVGAAVLWNLISFRATTFPVSYLDDSALHQQMVRFATAQFRAGHLPLTRWYPYLNIGSPHFLHYQSLGAMLTGGLGLITGPDAAYRWTLYLLMSFWPLAVFTGARLLGLSRAAAGVAAAMAPFLMSPTSIAYEPRAYVWIGYGVWAQLWASITLPLAWGFNWRAIHHGRSLIPAVVFSSLTVAFHFETGYLALISLILFPLVSWRPFRPRIVAAAIIAAGTAATGAWVIVPLLANRDWAAVNQALANTGLVNGYGWHVLGWLFSGRLADNARLPVISLLALAGFAVAVRRWRAEPRERALAVLLIVCLALAMGRSTFGALISLIPGNRDIFFRRFEMGVQLALLLLAGGGAVFLGEWALRSGERLARRAGRLARIKTWVTDRGLVTAPLLGVAALVAVLGPAWVQGDGVASANANAVAQQQQGDATQGRQVDRLLAVIRRDGARGRIYAGMPSNWGASFFVGQVPVFKYLAAKDVDESGFTLRTASLMSIPEYNFNEANPGDYALLGIRYLIMPADLSPFVPSKRIAKIGQYTLWRIASGSYFHVGQIAGRIGLDRTNVGSRTYELMHSDLPSSGRYLLVDYDHPTVPESIYLGAGAALPGRTLSESPDLRAGTASTQVSMTRPGIVVLSASYDPGWTATVDGHPSRALIVAPALVATPVPAGTHTVRFSYVGYGGYPWLALVGALGLAAVIAVDVRRRRAARPPEPVAPAAAPPPPPDRNRAASRTVPEEWPESRSTLPSTSAGPRSSS